MKKAVFQKLHKAIGVMLVFAMVVSLAACAKSNPSPGTENPAKGNTTEDQSAQGRSTEDKIVNIGMTDSISSVNPLLMDATEIMKTSTALEFLPLVELNRNLEFEGMLASSITTEDNIHFTVNIDPNASWSDGQPVTADDVVYTVLKLSSPVRANASMALYAIEGVGDDGFSEEGATELSGV
ncbi:MAG TPA: ABC transporter substrate-binding protein, partial [Clostridium sp.]|nr:ABC transporter substrate-binding protein [Clostridium sp.]